MSGLSARFMLSPRFFALPCIALAVIVALAHASANRPAATEVAMPKVRAIVCTAANVADPACAVVRDETRFVR